MLFSSYGQLVASDTDTSKDIYRYDAVTGSLGRVSVGEDGYDANGNDSRFDATIPYEKLQEANVYKQEDMETRAISEDGSRDGVHDRGAAVARCRERSGERV